MRGSVWGQRLWFYGKREGGGTMKEYVITSARIGALVAAIAFPAAPVFAYWQFMERPPGVEVKPSPRYASKKACETAIKQAEASLKKTYPNRYPLVGSCEEYR